MGSSNEDEDKAVSGEVKTAEEQKAEEKRMAIREQNRVSIAGAIFSRLSKVLFINVWLEKKVSTSRTVVREEKGLYFEHEKGFGRLEDIDIFLREEDAQAEAGALAAERRLAEGQRKAAARETDDEIYKKQKKYEEDEIDMKLKYALQIEEAKYKNTAGPTLESSEEI